LTPASELLARFTKPAAEYGPLPLWWWSGAALTRPRLRWQLERLLEQGVTQAVVICLAPAGPTYGCLADDPPFLSERWLELLDGVCEDAHKLGFRLWMYDQLGFSGANIQGAIVAQRPEFAGVTLLRYADGEIEQAASGYDYFGLEACQVLLDSVHGTLERHVGRWFGSVIPGFFQDELPALPTWGHDFRESFASAYGYDLWPLRAVLFEGADPESGRVRRDYHEHRASLARYAFFDQLADWLERRGLECGFDQQSPAREGDPIGGVRLYGDYLTTHARFQLPGTDHWGDPKVHSSLAHAHGHQRAWFEAFHSTGWGGTLEETFDWLAPALRRGATLYNPHAVYYATAGGWWEWAAPSTCWRQPYWSSYGEFASAVRRLCSVLTAGTHVCGVVLVSPTSTVQANLTLAGPLPAAQAATAGYHALNGTSCWFAEERGVLERAGLDHDVFDERVLAAGDVVDGELRIGGERYRGVVLPTTDRLLPEAAARLIEFSQQGGTLICVGEAPPELAGVARVVDTPDDVPAELDHLHTIQADAPYLLRRVANLFVLLLVAHDERSGTKAPIVDLGVTSAERAAWEGEQWGKFWFEYRRQLRQSGYNFVPPYDRVAHVRITGFACSRAQRWNPRSGRLTELAVDDTGETSLIDVPFLDGPIALVVFGDDLPDAVVEKSDEPIAVTPLDRQWLALAESTLDNADGDLASADRAGRLPIELWRLEHSTEEGWQPVLASFGPFANVAAEDGTWSKAEWSLSRGVQKDPVHGASLGPKGYVPEEFLVWQHVSAGSRVRARTHLPLPCGDRLQLAIGANASRRVVLDGVELPVEGDGYQTFSELPTSAAGRTVCVELELTAERDGPIRASFALVSDRERYRRPAWLVGDELTCEFVLDELPPQAVVQVASHGACAVFVNDTEVGRQGEFEPYLENSPARALRYDVRSWLRTGRNAISLRLGAGAAAAVDSRDLPVASGSDWAGARLSLDTHGYDPRFVCVDARPHPLSGAAWLEDAAGRAETVTPVIPQLAPAVERTELLRFTAPLGLIGFKLPTDLEVVAQIEGNDHRPVDAWVRLEAPLPTGTPIVLRVSATDGRCGGALLDHGLEVELAEAETELRAWEELGLRTLGGQVRYGTLFRARGGCRTEIDLGAVRGTAEVLVNGTLVDRLIWGPWRVDATAAIQAGENRLDVVVRGTLAGYLDDTSPTMEVVAGQVRTGLFGPVRLLEYAPSQRHPRHQEADPPPERLLSLSQWVAEGDREKGQTL
jgi:hypothetical protein